MQQVEIRNQQVLTGTQGERSIEQESISIGVLIYICQGLRSWFHFSAKFDKKFFFAYFCIKLKFVLVFSTLI